MVQRPIWRSRERGSVRIDQVVRAVLSPGTLAVRFLGARLCPPICALSAVVRHQALVRITPALRALQKCLLSLLACARLPRWGRNSAGLFQGLRTLHGCERARMERFGQQSSEA